MSTLFYKIKRKVYKIFHPVTGEILMLHRVVEKQAQLEANRQMEVTPEFLGKTILEYKAKGYQFVSLNEVHDIVNKQKKVKQKFVCFTFDDGYVDNYEMAYPIFKKYNCPFAIFVTTNFPDHKALLWWYTLEDVLLENDEFVLGNGCRYDCSTFEKKNTTFDAVRQMIFNMPSQDFEQSIVQLFSNYTYSFVDKCKALSLSWNQIEELAKDNLCTIGSHTVSHGVLPNLSVEEVEKELRVSKLKLEQGIKKKVDHFAYPYGAWNEIVVKQVKLAGYKSAFLANGGKLRKGADVLKLKRLN